MPKIRLDRSGSYAPLREFHVTEYGTVDTTGAADSSPAVLAAIAAAQVDGGVVVFPRGVTRVDSQIVLSYEAGSPPTMKSLRLRGEVAEQIPASGTPSVSAVDLRYSGGGTGEPKIDTRGKGLLEVDRLAFIDQGTSSNPFLRTTNTGVHIHDVMFQGNPTKSEATCDQDAIILGGTSATTGGSGGDGAFQGYVSVVERVTFSRIRRGVYLRAHANSCIVRDSFWDVTCGADSSAAAIEFDPGIDASIWSCLISGNCIEVPGYVYGVKMMNGCQRNIIEHNGFWDDGGGYLHDIYCDTDAINNFFILSGRGSGTIEEATPGANLVWAVQSGSVSLAGAAIKVEGQANGGTPLTVYHTATPLSDFFAIRNAADDRLWYVDQHGTLRIDPESHGTYMPVQVVNYTFGNYTAEFRNEAYTGVQLGGAAHVALVNGAGTGQCDIRAGAGTPEGNVTAPVGSVYFRTDGGAGTTLYVKESGAGNTGWAAK